ncbi:hypothetical protein TCON_1298 [Astathelohania contejeani]|uniref:Uncharacterized protein n=1 Tax=Astathelohania contejeani TaxID=164912 RepID=A0ABQ7HZ76_9MICR|nr:hypothetical protein TCON_1298 [Thelohania contejeani]
MDNSFDDSKDQTESNIYQFGSFNSSLFNLDDSRIQPENENDSLLSTVLQRLSIKSGDEEYCDELSGEKNDDAYLVNIYNLFVSINNKLDFLGSREHKKILALLKLGRIEEAKEQLSYTVGDVSIVDVLIGKELDIINNKLRDLLDKISQLKQKETEKKRKLRSVLEKEIKPNLKKEIKREMIELIIEELGIANEHRIEDNDDIGNIIQKYKHKYEEKNKLIISKLQKENLSFSESINKFTEKNIKLKKDCVLLANEVNKFREANKKKNMIIEKQKRIIDLLQRNISNTTEYPIIELKDRINKLRREMENEDDPIIKNKMMEKIDDYERRVEDFIFLELNDRIEKNRA